MTSPKTGKSLAQLGHDLRSARLRRNTSVADLAVRAGTSPSTIARLEKGDPGVGIGTLADVLVVFGLAGRLAELVDIRNDDIGLALDAERLPRRGRTSARNRTAKRQPTHGKGGETDEDGVAF